MKLPLKVTRKERPKFKGLKLHFIGMAIAIPAVYLAIEFNLPSWLSLSVVFFGFTIAIIALVIGLKEFIHHHKTLEEDEYKVIQPWEESDDANKSNK